MPRILIVEDERILAKNFRDKLRAAGHDASVSHSAEEALSVCGKLMPDVVVLDLRLPDADGLQLLPRLRIESPSTAVIVVTAHGSERIAVDAMKAGAAEYLSKPVDLDELLIVVNRAVEQQQLRDSLSFLRGREEEDSGLERIVGDSAATRNLKETLRRLTRADILSLPNPPTVLITGETGSGKDLAARAIHYHGPRAKKPFIHVNCTALPDTLVESELFGHVRGAFTSASQAKRGLFEVAHGGTIFLDEIGNMALEMQSKLLQVLESRVIRPVGGTDSRPIDVHIIAATNRDLERAVAAEEFRRDLYHRLRVLQVHLPPLRERTEDILPLAKHFLRLHCQRFGLALKSLADDAAAALARCEWRGNVRELSHVVESVVLQVDGAVIQAEDLKLEPASAPGAHLQLSLPGGRLIEIDFDRGEPKLEEIELTILQAAFEHTRHNLSQAARSLGITREALRYRLNKYSEAVQHGA
ncbi:MAG: sigma-54 dependent transcriptional regulator [Phycisphaerae bacterium]